MKYLDRIRKNVYYTRDKRVAIILEESGAETCIVDYKKDGKKQIEFGWGFLIPDDTINEFIALIKVKLL